MMNFRLARPTALVDVTRIEGLSYLTADPQDGLRIGALTTHRAVETSRDPAVLAGFGVLPRSARWIGHYPIRSRGTFGGSIAHAAPASEWCLLAMLLGAQVVLTGPQRWFPQPAPRAVHTEFAQRQGDFAVVAAAVCADIEDGVCRSGRVVLGGVGPLPVQVNADALAGQPATTDTWQAMGEHAAGQVDPPEDTHGSGEFRRRLTATLVSRALLTPARVRVLADQVTADQATVGQASGGAA